MRHCALPARTAGATGQVLPATVKSEAFAPETETLWIVTGAPTLLRRCPLCRGAEEVSCEKERAGTGRRAGFVRTAPAVPACARHDSNVRPPAPQAGALSPE